MEILIPVLTLGILGLLFGLGLAIASKKLEVKIDPRLEKIHGLLPGANCGACGGAGCFGFAESLLKGEANINACRVSSEEVKEQIAILLGKKLEPRIKRIAALHCNGGIKVKDRFLYNGLKDCISANLVMGGQKECLWGCLGFGDCVKVCPFQAIKMSEQGLPIVNKDKCRACNKCVKICPKKLFSLTPLTHPVYVACGSHSIGKDTKSICPVGCIACKLCEKACKFDAIHVIDTFGPAAFLQNAKGGALSVNAEYTQNKFRKQAPMLAIEVYECVDNLAVIDYKKCTSCGECVKACPMKTIIVRG